MTMLIGADPEVFLKVGTKNISSHGLINGDKKNPLKVDKGAVQIDGTALEFNIDPASTEEEFVGNIKMVMSTMEAMVKEKVPTGRIDISPSVIYDEMYFNNEIPLSAKELGCDPDYNAYTGRANPPPDPSKIKWPTMRTGSGHIHIGWGEKMEPLDPDHMADCMFITKVMDAVLYNISGEWDQDDRRSALYGKPGAFRPKPYGMEYRVLSNAWLGSEKTIGKVFKYTRAITDWLEAFEKVSNSRKENVFRYVESWTAESFVKPDKYISGQSCYFLDSYAGTNVFMKQGMAN